MSSISGLAAPMASALCIYCASSAQSCCLTGLIGVLVVRTVALEMASTIGIGLLGCGAVGSVVARILLEEGSELTARAGTALQLRHVVVRDVSKSRPVALPEGVLATDAASMLADEQTRIVVEVAGGIEPAKTMILDALQAGKDVVTANKALLATHGRELFAAARRGGRCIAFEAAVAGGIPVIEAIRRGLVANRIDAVYGILNGTCNYILTRMLQDNCSYAHALAEAQQLGYAEADPTLDIEGTDSAHKLAILASVAMRRACDLDRIECRGIAHLELADLVAGAELGYVCKLLAIAKRYADGIDLSVQPTFIPEMHPLASVSGPFNAVSVCCSAVGHVLFYGRGAGGAPTASAVIADIIDVATGNARRTFDQIAVLPDQTPAPIYREPGESSLPWYLRLGLVDRPGCIGRIATILGDAGISIATIVQHEPLEERTDGAVPVVVTTRPAKEKVVRQALSVIAGLDVVLTRPVCIPVLDEDVE